jgi:hypothetical protein
MRSAGLVVWGPDYETQVQIQVVSRGFCNNSLKYLPFIVSWIHIALFSVMGL